MRTSSQRRNPRRTLWFMAFLWLLVIGGTAVLSNYALDASRRGLMADLERSMTTQSQNQATLLTIWFGSLRDQALQTADGDMLRLFASEADEKGMDANALLQSAEKDPASLFLSDEESPNSQAALLRRELSTFAGKFGMATVALYNTRCEAYVSTEPSEEAALLSPAQEEALKTAMAERRPEPLPARLAPGGSLLLDFAVPVLAPLYVDGGKKAVGALLFSIDATAKIAEITNRSDGSPESVRLLQQSGGKLQEVAVDGTAPRELPGWVLNDRGVLPLDVRVIPARQPGGPERVYSLAMPVPGLPWLVEHDLPEEDALARYAAYRQTVLFAATLACALAGLVLFMLWWWLLGRGERAMAQEMRALYEVVNRQKQIIDGVNTALADAIVLTDNNGTIPYANQAFALMAGENPATLEGKACRDLASLEVARNITVHHEAVRRANAVQTFTDILNILGRPRHYQVVCSPFLDEEGRMTGVVSVYRDISRLVEAQKHAQHMVTQTVNVFVRAIEAVDPYLRGQSARTGVLAAALARNLELPDHEATLRTAANLSQIGMIQLPNKLITKTSRLTAEERAQLERHIEYAQAALEGIDFGLPVLEAIMQMHERLDGSGYPRHLKGDQIGMDGRILAVANSFCAMLRPRSYRQARGLEDAFNALASGPYDQEVVAMLRMYLDTPAGQEFLAGLTASE